MEQTNKDICDNSPSAESISVDALCSGDTVLVQTQRSLYRFCVSDVARRKGLLTGGTLGDQMAEATFAGTVLTNFADLDSWKLKPGFRAVFFIEKERVTGRILTSQITKLTLMKGKLIEERAA